MKKGTKYILLAVLGVILVVTAVNFNKIRFMYNMISSYNRLKDENVHKLPEDDTDEYIEVVENPIKKIIGDIEDNKGNEDIPVSNETPEENEKEPDESSEGNENKPTDNVDNGAHDKSDDKSNNKSKDELYKSIVTKYYDVLTALQQEYETKINDLVESGYEEYKSGEVSILSLASKYLSLGSKLESESDKKVNALLKDMEKELKDNNLDTSIVKEVKDYYNYLKSLRRSQLMSKAKSYID